MTTLQQQNAELVAKIASLQTLLRQCRNESVQMQREMLELQADHAKTLASLKQAEKELQTLHELIGERMPGVQLIAKHLADVAALFLLHQNANK